MHGITIDASEVWLLGEVAKAPPEGRQQPCATYYCNTRGAAEALATLLSAIPGLAIEVGSPTGGGDAFAPIVPGSEVNVELGTTPVIAVNVSGPAEDVTETSVHRWHAILRAVPVDPRWVLGGIGLQFPA